MISSLTQKTLKKISLYNFLPFLGANWPNSVALYLVDDLTHRTCTADPDILCKTTKMVKVYSSVGSLPDLVLSLSLYVFENSMHCSFSGNNKI